MLWESTRSDEETVLDGGSRSVATAAPTKRGPLVFSSAVVSLTKSWGTPLKIPSPGGGGAACGSGGGFKAADLGFEPTPGDWRPPSPAPSHEAVKNSPGGGTGPPTVLETPCESLEAACPRAVLSRYSKFLHSFPPSEGIFIIRGAPGRGMRGSLEDHLFVGNGRRSLPPTKQES